MNRGTLIFRLNTARSRTLGVNKEINHGSAAPDLRALGIGVAAICVNDAAVALQYRGRLDESKGTRIPNARRELVEAMRQVAETNQGPREQIAAMGCSIKWKCAA